MGEEERDIWHLEKQIESIPEMGQDKEFFWCLYQIVKDPNGTAVSGSIEDLFCVCLALMRHLFCRSDILNC